MGPSRGRLHHAETTASMRQQALPFLDLSQSKVRVRWIAFVTGRRKSDIKMYGREVIMSRSCYA